MKVYLDTLILGLGIFFVGFGSYLIYLRYTPIPYVEPTEVVSTSRAPASIHIDSLDIHLPVSGAKIVGNVWDVQSESVSYLLSSPLPGEVGNSIMYGHNWPNLLADLRKVRVGDHIRITLESGDIVDYIVHFVTEVTPDQTHIFQNTTDRRLTLYTCSGFMDSKRLVVTAIVEG